MAIKESFLLAHHIARLHRGAQVRSIRKQRFLHVRVVREPDPVETSAIGAAASGLRNLLAQERQLMLERNLILLLQSLRFGTDHFSL